MAVKKCSECGGHIPYTETEYYQLNKDTDRSELVCRPCYISGTISTSGKIIATPNI